MIDSYYVTIEGGKTVRMKVFVLFIIVLCLSGCLQNDGEIEHISIRGDERKSSRDADPANTRDSFINNPFVFTILKNISDDYASIGAVKSNRVECPLEKENIADPAFCMIRSVVYEDLTLRVFSFDAAGCGTAEYIVNGPSLLLRNGLSLSSGKKAVVKAMGRPYKIEGNDWVWKSKDLGNYLIFSFSEDEITRIRWHESRDVTYGDVRVWETRH